MGLDETVAPASYGYDDAVGHIYVENTPGGTGGRTFSLLFGAKIAGAREHVMSLSDLASLGSFISGIAVIISLVYLAQQIRQNTKHSRAAIGHGFATRTVDFNYRMIDEKFAAAIIKGRSASSELTEVEIFQFMAYCRATFWGVADTFAQHRSGLMDDAIFASFERAQVGMMQAPGMQIAWKLSRGTFAPEFVIFLDGIAAEAKASGILDFSASWLTAIAAEYS